MSDDLHSHSTASDGRLSPAELVAYVHQRGVTRLALTDHDTLGGLAEARAAGRRYGVDVINGIELSAGWRSRTLHIVGLGIDDTHAGLRAGVAAQQAERERRAAALVERVTALGITDVGQRIDAMVGTGQVTRAHFARLIVAEGKAHRVADAFKRYLAPGRPAHVRAEWATLEAVITWIRAAGGIAVFAHPFGYGFTGAWRRRALAAFVAAGGTAVEISTGTTSVQQEQQIARDAREWGLAGSLGSDFHGPDQFWLTPGRLRPLPEDIPSVVERLAGG